MVEALRDLILMHGWNIYSIALATDTGIESAVCVPGNKANEGYSTAKLFTNTAVAVLWDRGKIDLDAPLTQLLKDEIDFSYDPRWDRVTVRNALSHKMGVDRGVLDIDVHDTNTIGTDDFLRYMLAYPPVEAPGGTFRYTDVAHYLVSRAVAAHCGKKIDEILREFVFSKMDFRPVAFRCCPKGYPMGATGMYMETADMVKLPWLYINGGVYQGKRVVSEAWIDICERERFDWTPLGDTGYRGKGGMLGQNMLGSRKDRVALAWHAYIPRCEEDITGLLLEKLAELK